jgi:hypothetical protein
MDVSMKNGHVAKNPAKQFDYYSSNWHLAIALRAAVSAPL